MHAIPPVGLDGFVVEPVPPVVDEGLPPAGAPPGLVFVVIGGTTCALELKFAFLCTAKKPMAENPLKMATVVRVRSIFPRVSILLLE